MSLLSITLILFFIMDPVGKVAFVGRFLGGLENRRTIIVRELVIALAMMMLFNFIGELLFDVLKVSQTTVILSSGIILFLAAIRILFPSSHSSEPTPATEDPILVPLSIPTFCGPALLATIMLFADSVPEQSTMIMAIIIAWAIAGLIYLMGEPIRKALGSGGLLAAERLMALILVMMSLQRLFDGIRSFVETFP